MLVKEVMTKGAECVGPDDTLQEAARKMKLLDVGPLPVCANGRLTGMLTDRDIVVRCVADGGDTRSAHVREAMTEGIAYCYEDDDVTQASRLMKEEQIRRLPVLDRAEKLVGIVSLGDLAVELGDENLVGKTLEKVSASSRPIR